MLHITMLHVTVLADVHIAWSVDRVCTDPYCVCVCVAVLGMGGVGNNGWCAVG